MKIKRIGRSLASLTLALLLAGVAGTATAQDEREAMRAEIAALKVRVETVAEGPAERLADQELARARVWIDQAEEARTRRNLKLARLYFNNAAMDLKVAEAMVESFALVQERKQVIGQVQALQRTVEEAQASDEVQQ